MADIRTILANNANSSFKKRKEKHQAAAPVAIEENRTIEVEEKEAESLMKVQPSVRGVEEALYGVALGDFPLSDDVLGRDEILNENGHILSGLVATESMLSNSIDGDRIVSGTLSGKKIKDGTIESSKIGQKQVKASNLDDSAVTTNKIQDGAVTPEKLSKTYAEASSLSVYAKEQEVQDAFDDIGSKLSNEINPKISAIADEVSAEVRRMDELSGKVEVLSGTVVSDYALKTEIPLSVGQLTNDKDYVTSSDLELLKVLKYKGTKQTFDELPPNDENQIGDVWNVVEAHGDNPAGTNYAWNGSEWDPLGGSIDVSVFAKDDAVVHLSGDETLSGDLYKWYQVNNPSAGRYEIPIINDSFNDSFKMVSQLPLSTSIIQQLLEGNLSIDYSILIPEGEYVSEWNESGDPIVSVLLQEEGYGVLVWTFGKFSEYGHAQLVFEASGVSEEYRSYLSSYSGMLELIKSDLPISRTVMFTKNMSDAEHTSIEGWDAISSYFEECRDKTEFLEKTDRFALTSDIQLSANALRSKINDLSAKALTAETEPKFTAWKNNYGAVSALIYSSGPRDHRTKIDIGQPLSNANYSIPNQHYINIGANNTIALDQTSNEVAIAIGRSANANGSKTIAIGSWAIANMSEAIAIGSGACTPKEKGGSYDDGLIWASNIAIGQNAGFRARTENLSANGTIVIGSRTAGRGTNGVVWSKSPAAKADFAIQLGCGTNDEVSSFQVYDWKLLDQNGDIPYGRLSAVLEDYSPAGDYISKQALRDALSSNLSTLTPVNYNDPQDAALSVLWKNVGILQNALSSVMEMANS